jgi:hypothetical protein
VDAESLRAAADAAIEAFNWAREAYTIDFQLERAREEKIESSDRSVPGALG